MTTDHALSSDCAWRMEIRAARKRLGLSQERFAADCGIHHTYLSKIERGRVMPSAALIRTMGRLCGVNPDWLLANAEQYDHEYVRNAIEAERKRNQNAVVLADLVLRLQAHAECCDPCQDDDACCEDAVQRWVTIVHHAERIQYGVGETFCDVCGRNPCHCAPDWNAADAAGAPDGGPA